MAFDLASSIPVKETEEGQVTTQQFDIASSRPVSAEPNKPTPYEDYLKTEFDKDIKSAVLQELTPDEMARINTADTREFNSFVSGLIPFVKGSAGFFTRPFGVEPLGDSVSPAEVTKAKEKHPVAFTIGEITGGIAPFIVTAPLFPQSLLGSVATFGTVGAVTEKGQQEAFESIMTPQKEQDIDVIKA